MTMDNILSAISQIAENRIREAMEAGQFDNLPGQGKPLVFEDTSHIPEDLRMPYKILKNAGCIPPELARRKEIGNLADLLDSCPSEQEKLKCMRKLRYLLQKSSLLSPDQSMIWEDEYYSRILARLEAHERDLKS